MQTLIAYGAVACAVGYGVLLFIRSMRSMRRPNRDCLKPGCGACGRGCRQRKDARYGEN